MLFNSFEFLVFFSIFFILYWKIPRKFRWLGLLFGSYYFYFSYKPAYLGLIILTTIINYYAALFIFKAKNKKTILLLALIFNLGLLFIFKYYNFFSITIKDLLGNQKILLPNFKLLLPLGISFYTFQTISYLVDIYRGNLAPEKHFGRFALYLCFFPQVSSGPIPRGNELLPQINSQFKFDYYKTVSGLKLFVLGLFKKMVIADNLALVVDNVFGKLFEFKGLSLILTIYIFAWQIYMDFSGYTDMARGIARMLGFELVENFNKPYLSTSVRNFWQRWHMSLSRWFRDYLYIPLGGNRRGLLRTCLNIMIIFTLCGLWHGASWNFVIWGILHGILMSLERVGGKIIKFKFPAIIKIVYTYTVISICWVFFRATNLNEAIYILKYSLVGWKNFFNLNYFWSSMKQLFDFNHLEISIISFLLFAAILIELIPRFSLSNFISKQPAILRYTIYIMIIILIVHLRNVNIKEFVYVRF